MPKNKNENGKTNCRIAARLPVIGAPVRSTTLMPMIPIPIVFAAREMLTQ